MSRTITVSASNLARWGIISYCEDKAPKDKAVGRARRRVKRSVMGAWNWGEMAGHRRTFNASPHMTPAESANQEVKRHNWDNAFNEISMSRDDAKETKNFVDEVLSSGEISGKMFDAFDDFLEALTDEMNLEDRRWQKRKDPEPEAEAEGASVAVN